MLDRVRSACKTVAAQARHVTIATGRLKPYAKTLPLDRARAPEIDRRKHYYGTKKRTIEYFVTLDAINFGSGFWAVLKKRPGMSGYYTIAASLRDHFRRYDSLTAAQLSLITPPECASMFGQDPRSPAIMELMELFARAMNDLGTFLNERFNGQISKLVESARGSAERLAATLIEMPMYRDVQTYKGIEVPFYKRAQLTAADLYLALEGQSPAKFTDLDRLTIFADNLVPHVLRVDGILEYSEDLARRIEHKEEIPAGSEEEIEIRACAVHAVELIGEEVRRDGIPITSMDLDYLFWNKGQSTYYKMVHPRHRTRTMFY